MAPCVQLRNARGLLVETFSVSFLAVALLLFKLVKMYEVDFAFLTSMWVSVVILSPPVIWNWTAENFQSVKSDKWLLALRGLLSACNIILQLSSVKFIGVSDVVAIAKCSPVSTALLGFLLYGERINKVQIVLLLCSVVGAVVVCRPDFIFNPGGNENSLERLLGFVLAVCSAFSTSLSYVVTKSIRKTPVNLVMFFVSLLNGLVVCPVVLARGSWDSLPCGPLYYAGIASRVIGFLGFALRILAIRMEDVSKLALVYAFDLPLVIVCEVAFMGASHPWTSYLGAGGLVFCVTLSMLCRGTMTEDAGKQQEVNPPKLETTV